MHLSKPWIGCMSDLSERLNHTFHPPLTYLGGKSARAATTTKLYFDISLGGGSASFVSTFGWLSKEMVRRHFFQQGHFPLNCKYTEEEDEVGIPMRSGDKSQKRVFTHKIAMQKKSDSLSSSMCSCHTIYSLSRTRRQTDVADPCTQTQMIILSLSGHLRVNCWTVSIRNSWDY